MPDSNPPKPFEQKIGIQAIPAGAIIAARFCDQSRLLVMRLLFVFFLRLILLAALTFGFVVLFEHGPAKFSEGAKTEWNALLFFVGSVISKQPKAPARDAPEPGTTPGPVSCGHAFSNAKSLTHRDGDQPRKSHAGAATLEIRESDVEAILEPLILCYGCEIRKRSAREPKSDLAQGHERDGASELWLCDPAPSGRPKDHPDFLLGRQLARKAAVAKFAGEKRSVLGSLSGASLFLMKLQSQVKKDPVAAFDAIEKMLEADPYSPKPINF